MLGITFHKSFREGRYGVIVEIPEAEPLLVCLPERLLLCHDVEEAMVEFLEIIDGAVKSFVRTSMLNISDLQLEQTIFENLGLITAVYRHCRDLVHNETDKEDV